MPLRGHRMYTKITFKDYIENHQSVPTQLILVKIDKLEKQISLLLFAYWLMRNNCLY